MSAGPGPGADWGWTDRGVPPGQLVFAIAGAVTLSPSSPIAIVITLNGHPWAVAPAGTGSGWTDLGVPAPSEKIVVGIGAQTAGGALEVAALGAPSGQIWTARWTPGQAAAEWTARGRPADQRIRDIIGMVPGPAGNLIGVIGHDQQIWVMSTASPAPSWTRWDPPTATTTVTSGRAMVLLRQLPCAIVLDQTKRVQIVSSPS